MNNQPTCTIKGDEGQTIMGTPYMETSKASSTKERIEKMINSSPIFIFIKGTPTQPKCGFSANTLGIINRLGKSYKTFDILSDEEIRAGVKEYSNWPTYPQVYINGKLIGGNDILTELNESGELSKLV